MSRMSPQKVKFRTKSKSHSNNKKMFRWKAKNLSPQLKSSISKMKWISPMLIWPKKRSRMFLKIIMKKQNQRYYSKSDKIMIYEMTI